MPQLSRRTVFAASFALAVGILGGGVAQAAKSTLNVTFDTRSIASALWVPDNLDVIRGVLVFTGGQGPNDQSGDTRQLTGSKFYQRFAESIGFAILGNQFTGSYTEAGSGPGQALLDSLTVYASKLNHPELARAPLLLEGFSNGGYFSFTFAKFLPARVIAFALNKSGFAKAELDPKFAAVPGVLFWGEDEATKGMPTVIHALVVQGRAQHALWAELKEWGKGHEEGDVERMFVPFFADMVAARYPNGMTPLTAEVPLNALAEASGWLGDHTDASINANLPRIASFAAYGGDKAAASWLPSEGLANLWRGFVTKTPIALDAPASESQLSAAQPLQLSASGLATGENVNFLDAANELASDVAVSGGQAKAQWIPTWGGGRGILAVAKAAGVVTRTSRPAVIALYGKAPPPGPPQPEPSADPAGAGPGGVKAGMRTVGNGAPTAGVGPVAGAAGASDAAAGDLVAAAGDASGEAGAAASGGAHRSHASGSCSLAQEREHRTGIGIGLAVFALVARRTRRSNRRQRA